MDKSVPEGHDIIGIGGKGYEFKLKSLPKTYNEFKDLFMIFIDVFDVTFTLSEDKFEKIRKYAEPDSIKEVNNIT